MKPRRTKYNNRRAGTEYVVTDPAGTKHNFDSNLEAEVFLRLLDLQKRGILENTQFGIQRQVPFDLLPPHGTYKKPLICTVDFLVSPRGARPVLIEAKSKATAKARDWPIRKRLLSHVTTIPLLEASDPEQFHADVLAGKTPLFSKNNQ